MTSALRYTVCTIAGVSDRDTFPEFLRLLNGCMQRSSQSYNPQLYASTSGKPKLRESSSLLFVFHNQSQDLVSSPQKTRIAIVGAGIGGLTLAVALSHLNLDEFVQVDVYESTSKLTQVGAGITFSPRAWEILRSMGLEEALAARFSPGKELPEINQPELAYSMRKSDQHQGSLIKDIVIPGGSISFYRADVQEILLENISSKIQIHLGHRLSTYRQTKTGVDVEFTNGESTSCDILIGADGIHSAVRRVFLAEGKGLSEEEEIHVARPLWTGTIAYRHLIDSELLRKDYPNHPALTTPTQYCGKNKHLVTYPIIQGKLVNVVLFISDLQKEGTYFDGTPVVHNSADNFASLLEKWEEDATIVIKYMVNPSRWAIQTLRPLDTYVSGRVLLMGDAAHSMAPHLGQGAGQAIEDAYILSNLISKTVRQKNLNVHKMASVYDTIRQPFGNFVVEATRKQGLRYELNVEGFEDVIEGGDVTTDKLAELGKSIEKAWAWTCQSARGDLEKALAML